METFGEWLQHQRSLRRLTREEFAKRIGCSVFTLRKIKYGEPPGRSTGGAFNLRASGELSVDRLFLESKSVATTSISSTKTNLPTRAGEKTFEVVVEDVLQ